MGERFEGVVWMSVSRIVSTCEYACFELAEAKAEKTSSRNSQRKRYPRNERSQNPFDDLYFDKKINGRGTASIVSSRVRIIRLVG